MSVQPCRLGPQDIVTLSDADAGRVEAYRWRRSHGNGVAVGHKPDGFGHGMAMPGGMAIPGRLVMTGEMTMTTGMMMTGDGYDPAATGSTLLQGTPCVFFVAPDGKISEFSSLDLAATIDRISAGGTFKKSKVTNRATKLATGNANASSKTTNTNRSTTGAANDNGNKNSTIDSAAFPPTYHATGVSIGRCTCHLHDVTSTPHVTRTTTTSALPAPASAPPAITAAPGTLEHAEQLLALAKARHAQMLTCATLAREVNATLEGILAGRDTYETDEAGRDAVETAGDGLGAGAPDGGWQQGGGGEWRELSERARQYLNPLMFNFGMAFR